MFEAISDADSETVRHPAVDLEHRKHPLTTVYRRLVMRNRIFVDRENRPVWPDEKHIEGDQRVLHPERHRLRLGLDEQHPREHR
jgi:hypothetical protein